MNTPDGNQLNMALVVQKLITENKQVWNNHKGFTKQVNAMTKQLEIIQLHQKNAEVKTEGITKDKANAAGHAIEMGKDLAGSALVYAKEEENEMLKAQFSITGRELTNVQGVVALSRLKELRDNLDAIIDKLGDNVTEEELKNFELAIIDFEYHLPNPRKTITNREMSNAALVVGVAKLKDIFANMDKLITKFKNTEFEKEYKLARMVIDLGTHKGKGKGDEPKDDEPDKDGPKE